MNATKYKRNEASWIFDNEKLIEKLESAYQISSNEKDISGVLRLYGFKVGNLNLIIDEATSCEIVEENHIHFVPLSAEWLVGVSNIRGDVVPIIDLEKLINGDSTKVGYKNYKLAIIGKGEDSIGIELDDLPVQLELNESQEIFDYSNQAKHIQRFIQFAYLHNDDTWLCIDFPSLIQSISN